jgi:hypothetical protein
MDGRVTVSIIGTAGRKEDADKMNKDVFDRMTECASTIISSVFKITKPIRLVSGGAAWSDHVAVRLFLELAVVDEKTSPALTLHLPCPWVVGVGGEDTGPKDWKTNPGRTMNQLHHQMSRSFKTDTLLDIDIARLMGAKIVVHKGFHARNSVVASSDYLIAFTWGESLTEPKDGGTADTWKKSKCKKVHVPLGSLMKDKDLVSRLVVQ